MHHAWHYLALGFGLFSATIAGCGDSDEGSAGPTVPHVPEARSAKQRLAATAPDDAIAKLAHENADFAFELVRSVAPAGNLFCSPHSLSIALGMTYAGAAGDTKLEMQKTLHFDQPDPELHAAFNGVDQALASRGKNAKGLEGQPFRLRVTNAVWAQDGFGFLPSFLDVLAENYGAGVKLVDFSGDAAGAIDLINAWVNAVTAEKIPSLLGDGDVDSQTRLVLTNAVYFNASWDHSFRPSDTSLGEFTRLDGSSVTVPLMHGMVARSYADGSGYQAAELDYDGNEVSMLLIVPDPGTFTSFEQTLDAQELEDVVAALVPEDEVYVTLPKLELKTHVELADTLAKMGMPSAFDESTADFSGMDGAKDLYIAHVVHEAVVSVDEAGTEAAAASAVAVSLKDGAAIAATMPFYFAIRDKATGTVIFLGRVVDPSHE